MQAERFYLLIIILLRHYTYFVGLPTWSEPTTFASEIYELVSHNYVTTLFGNNHPCQSRCESSGSRDFPFLQTPSFFHIKYIPIFATQEEIKV